MISIHASREGSDIFSPGRKSLSGYFNPRFPRGKRRMSTSIIRWNYPFQSTLPAGEATLIRMRTVAMTRFQSTLPAGEATEHSNNEVAYFVISIHASRGGSDVRLIHQAAQAGGFQSTLPAGEATLGGRGDCPGNEISIHASRGGSDSLIATHWQAAQGFQSTLPAGEATPWQWLLLQ